MPRIPRCLHPGSSTPYQLGDVSNKNLETAQIWWVLRRILYQCIRRPQPASWGSASNEKCCTPVCWVLFYCGKCFCSFGCSSFARWPAGLPKHRLRGELIALFLARPAGQSVLSSAGRPAGYRRIISHVRPAAGRTQFVFCPAGRLAPWMLLRWLCFWLADRPAGWLLSWLAGWLAVPPRCFGVWPSFWPAGRLAGWLCWLGWWA